VAGWTIEVEKIIESTYDTGEGDAGFKTYPAQLAIDPQEVYHGDRFVYTLTATMTGNGDAFEGDVMHPVIRDIPDASIDIIDLIGPDSGIDVQGRPWSVDIQP
jgi:hypothetical protein